MRFVVAILALAGCSREPLQDLADLAVPDAAAVDLGPPPDLTPVTDGPMCLRYTLAGLAITSLSLIDGPGNQYTGATIRLLAHTFTDECNVAGDLQVTVHPGNATDGIALAVRSWQRENRGHADCDFHLNSLYVIALGVGEGLSNPNIVATDNSPMATERITFPVAGYPMGATCNSAILLGNPCQLDCECQKADPNARCIPTAPQKGICALSCSEDVDCPQALPHCNFMGYPLFTCDKARPKPLCEEPFAFSHSSCRIGQDCSIANLCTPKMQVLSKPCNCYPDCRFGAICTDKGECRIPCTTVRDCPAGAKACVGAACE